MGPPTDRMGASAAHGGRAADRKPSSAAEPTPADEAFEPPDPDADLRPDIEPEPGPGSVFVYGSGRHYAWGKRDDDLAIWRLKEPWKVVETFPSDQRRETFHRFLALEHRRGPEPWRAPRSSRGSPAGRTLVATLSIVALVGLIAYLAVVRGVWGRLWGEPAVSKALGSTPVSAGTAPARPDSTTPIPSLPPGIGVHVSDQGGYLFSYPLDWELHGSGKSTELRNPEGDVLVSFGTAPSGSLQEASDGVVAAFTGSYADVRVVPGEIEQTAQGQPALAVGATATDATGASIRLLVVTIQGLDGNRAITVRFIGGADPVDVLPIIRGIVDSFRTSEVT